MFHEGSHSLRIDRRTLTKEILFHLIGKGIKIEGQENVPERGPGIVVFNHMGWAEVLAAIFCLPEFPVLFTKEENFRTPLLSNLLRRLEAIPVKRGEVDRQALSSAIKALAEEGKFIVTAPEGTRGRTVDGNRTELKKAHNGVVYIGIQAVRQLDQPIPVIPMAIWGTEGILPEIDEHSMPFSERLLFKRQEVHVRIAPPFLIEPRDQMPRGEELQTMTDTIMIIIRDKLPDEYHGYYRNMSAPREA